METLRKGFVHELDEIRNELVRMSASVTDSIHRATSILLDGRTAHER